MPAGYHTTSTAFLEALAEAGVSYIFANLGSDHPGLIEAFAQARAEGRQEEFPRLIVCPHETYTVTVSDPGELPGVLSDALAVTCGGRSAVVCVHLPRAQAAL